MNWFKRVFGRKFNIWDVLLLGILSYYLYGTYIGLDSPIWRVFEVFASAIFFVYVVSIFVNSFRRKTR